MLQLETVWPGMLFTTVTTCVGSTSEQLNWTISLKFQGHNSPMSLDLFTSENQEDERAVSLPPVFCPSPPKWPISPKNNLLLYRPFSFWRGWWFEAFSIDGNGMTFFLNSHNYHASQDRAVGWGAQCHSGAPHLIKHWKTDNYNFSRSTGDLTHVSRSLSELNACPSNKHICLQCWTCNCKPTITLTSGPLPSWGRTEPGHLQQYGPPLQETYSCLT